MSEAQLDQAPGTVRLRQAEQDRRRLIREATGSHGVDAALIRAMVRTDSGSDPSAVSPAGAKDLMQLMPGLVKEMGVADPFDPRQNGVGYIAGRRQENHRPRKGGR